MKIAFDVDVLAKRFSIQEMVYKVADWGFKYIEQSPHPRINPFYKHPLLSKECEDEYKKALKDTGLQISSFIVVYRWSGPTEEQRQHAVSNWKAIMEIAEKFGVSVINTELSGDPKQPEICNGMFFKSMEELLPIAEKRGIRIELQAHPHDFIENNNETCDYVKHFRSENLTYCYSVPHSFYYDNGKGDVASMLTYAGKDLSHVLFGDSFNHKNDCHYIMNPPDTTATIHQHLGIGEGEIDFNELFKILRATEFAQRNFKVGGEPIACVTMFGFYEKMEKWAISARERIEKELLK